MERFSLRDHFTWMIVAGAIIAANGIIQSVGGTQPLGVVSLTIGLLLVGLGFVRPRRMAKDRSAQSIAPETSDGVRSAQYVRPLALLLVLLALAIAVFSGLPLYFRNNLDVPGIVTLAMWAVLTLGIALLAYDWQRREPNGRWPFALILGVFLGLLAVSAATTSVVRSTAIAAWKTSHPVDQVLVFGVDHGGPQPPSETLLVDVQNALINILEAYGQFHTPRRVGAENYAVLLSDPGALGTEDMPALIQFSYVGFHLVHAETHRLAPAASDGGHIPDGHRLVPARDGPLLIESRPIVTGVNIVDQKLTSGDDGGPLIAFKFDETGRVLFAEMTARNVGRRFAVVSAGRVHFSPVIREPIPSGTGLLSGFSDADAATIVRALYLGGLPAPLVLISQSVVEGEARSP